MKAVVFHGVGDIRLEDVPEPKIKDPTDAIVRLTASAICGTDLHLVRGTMPGMKKGTILGHEGVGVVEEMGRDVRNFFEGDRVVVCSTIACGSCTYCREGYFSQCLQANPKGPEATAFFGGPEDTGAFDGLQAEKARIPYANVTLVKVPDNVSDEQAILVSDILPTAWFGAELAEIKEGNSVAIFGCGPVGLFAILAARLHGAGRVFAIDTIASRLQAARRLGAEVIDFNEESPTEALKRLAGGSGVDRVIDAVGVDAVRAKSGPAKKESKKNAKDFEKELENVEANPSGGNWEPGDAPPQALLWAVESCAKGGTVSIIGVYPETAKTFPIGVAMGKNLTIKAGNCNHRRYVPKLLDMTAAGVIDPSTVLSHVGPMETSIDAYRNFDKREDGWIKVELLPTTH